MSIPVWTRRGFSMIEVSLTVTVLGLVTLIATPKMGTLINHSRVNRTTAIVAADLENAFTLAGRQRRPVRLSCACDSLLYRASDLSGGTVRLSRVLGGDTEFGVTGLVFSTTTLDIFPSGVASAPLTVTISAGGYSRQVTMTTAGLVRILPP